MPASSAMPGGFAAAFAAPCSAASAPAVAPAVMPDPGRARNASSSLRAAARTAGCGGQAAPRVRVLASALHADAKSCTRGAPHAAAGGLPPPAAGGGGVQHNRSTEAAAIAAAGAAITAGRRGSGGQSSPA